MFPLTLVMLTLFLLIILAVMYVKGHFTAISREEIRTDTYTVYCMGHPDGRKTYIVYKITYASGRFKFINKSYKH